MSRRTFYTFNPKENSFNTERYSCHTIEEVDVMIHGASKAHALLAEKTVLQVHDLLALIKENLILKKQGIADMYRKESGLSEGRFEVEFNRTLNQLELFSKHIIEPAYISALDRKQEVNGKHLSKRKIGIGPVLVLGASNFPLAYSTIGGDSVAALAAKNPVVLKAHPFHTGTSTLVANAIQKAIKALDFPAHTFSHVIDDRHDLATYIANSGFIKAIGFTGSQNGGEAFLKISNNRKFPIPVFAEMGSSNPVIILESVLKEDRELLIQKITNSVCNDSGQFCTKPGLFFVPLNKDTNGFIAKLKESIFQFPEQPMLHPNIQEEFEKKTALLKQTFGPDCFFQNNHSENSPRHFPKKSMLYTTCTNLVAFPFVQEEIFGPHTSVFTYSSPKQLIEILDQLKGQLTFSIFGSKEKDGTVLDELITIGSEKAGRIIMNDLPTGVEVAHTMHHGGPYPASSDSRFTAVGTDSIARFQRSVTFQDFRI
jgi:NADP-dependent aldehyde dehydrogenase